MSISSNPAWPPLPVFDRGDSDDSTPSAWSSITVATTIIASTVIISAAVFVIIRQLSKLFRAFRPTADDVVWRRRDVIQNPHPDQHADLLDSLPLFTFRSVTEYLNGGDCAVCLSKFQPNHQLRLLPLCCHAFHAGCIDKWIVANQTCPLCRSTVRASDSAALNKILSGQNGSFRVELGSVSRRREEVDGGRRRTYSLGSVEYVVDDCIHEVSDAPAVRNWLREYLVSISSRTMSFSSSRYLSGRRSDAAAVVPEENLDLEANRAGEEISEAFRWLSGI